MLTTNDRYNLVWQKYSYYKAGARRVIRSGFALFGVYPHEYGAFASRTRSESDAEHSNGLAVLLFLIHSFFPELFNGEDLTDYLVNAFFHEIGEFEYGDVPDDGKRDENKKNSSELIAFSDYFAEFPLDVSEPIIFNFIDFQQKNTSRFAQISYLGDKLEAILQAIIYESNGQSGSYDSEPLLEYGASESDQKLRELTGSTSMVDIFAAQFLLNSRFFDEEIRDVFINILRAAVIDLRGQWFPWSNRPPFNCP